MIKGDKKGVIELQFNWIFILIAGVLILMFFGSIILKLKAVSDQEVAQKLLLDIDNHMISSQSSPGVSGTISAPRLHLESDCNALKAGGLSRGLSGIIYSPALLKGNKLILWSQAWEMPYKATTFSYLTSDEVLYVIIQPPTTPLLSTFTREVFNALPERGEVNLKLNKELGHINIAKGTLQDEVGKDVTDLNKAFMRLLFFSDNDQPPKFPDQYDKSKSVISAAKVIPDFTPDRAGEVGEIIYYSVNKDSGEFQEDGSTSYLGRPMLYGAIFSDDMKIYNCLSIKAFGNLDAVSKLYSELVDILKTNPDALYCSADYDSAGTNIGNIASTSAAIVSGQRVRINDLGDILSAALLAPLSISNTNSEILGKGCPGIY